MQAIFQTPPGQVPLQDPNYAAVVIRLLANQYDGRFGASYAGGWSLHGYDSTPNPYVTVEVARALLMYHSSVGPSLPPSDPTIPTALVNALNYLSQCQGSNGSFGDTALDLNIEQLISQTSGFGTTGNVPPMRA